MVDGVLKVGRKCRDRGAAGCDLGGFFEPPLGLQLWSLRFQLMKDLPGTLKQIKAWGIGEVESAGFYGRSAAEFAGELEKAGLKCHAMHVDWDVLDSNMAGALEDAEAMGATTLLSAYLPHEREARARGIPAMGSGRVFPIAEEDITCEPVVIAREWAQIGGMDFGWDHPFAAVKLGPKVVHKDVLESIAGFFILYMGVFAAATIVMAGMGLDALTAISSVAATLGNIGPGLANVGPGDNYFLVPTAGKVLLTLCMILGRLEIYTVLILLAPEFWKK